MLDQRSINLATNYFLLGVHGSKLPLWLLFGKSKMRDFRIALYKGLNVSMWTAILLNTLVCLKTVLSALSTLTPPKYETKCIFQFEIIINVLVSSFRFI